MAVDFKTFNTFVNMVADSRYPVMIRGRHGIGKSELVYQFAARKGMPVVERRVSQLSEGDLMGLPVVDGDSTRWNPPDWYKQACNEAVVLFLDEVDRGTLEVRQGIFQLTDSRALNGHRLHPGTLIFAAVNGGVHGANYQVNDMDPAELDRWTVYDVEPTVEDWLTYAQDRVNPIIIDFIRHNKAHLEHSKEFEPGKVYPSRRSWERLSRTVDAAHLLEGDFKPQLPTLFNLSCGFVGFEAAISLRDFADKLDNIITPADLLAGKAKKAVKKWKLNDHVTMADKLVAEKALHANLSSEELENFKEYFLTMPSEAAMLLYTGISKNKDMVEFIKVFHKVEGVKPYITSMLAGNTKKKAE